MYQDTQTNQRTLSFLPTVTIPDASWLVPPQNRVPDDHSSSSGTISVVLFDALLKFIYRPLGPSEAGERTEYDP